MGDAAPLFLTVSVERARAAVAATLSEQGFVVHERGAILQVERDARADSAIAVASRVTFLVRFTAEGGRTIAHFGEAGGGAVVTAAVRVARARLAERGLVAEAEDSKPDAETSPLNGESDPERQAEVPRSGRAGSDGAATDAVVLAPTEASGEPGTAAEESDDSDSTEGDALSSVPTSPVIDAPSNAAPESASAPPLAGDPGEGSPPVGVDPPPQTGRPVSVIAMLAFVLAFIAPVGGIVAGVFALGILRRTREGGRGLAIAGIVVGAVLTIVVTAAVIAGISWLVVDTESPSTAPTSPTASSAPPRSETSSAGFELHVGQCFTQRGRGEVGQATVVDCATPHSYELYARFAVADAAAAYPGDEDIAHSAEAGCVEAFAGFVGRAYDRSALDYVYLSPTRRTWSTGDRLVSCLVTDAAGPVTGTLRDAER